MYGSRGWRTRDDKDVYSSMNLVNVNVKHDNWRCFGSKSINSREWKTNEKILRYLFYVFLGVLGIDLSTMLIYVVINGGFPK